MAIEVRAVLTSLVFVAIFLLIDNAVCLLGREAQLCPWGTATQKVCGATPVGSQGGSEQLTNGVIN